MLEKLLGFKSFGTIVGIWFIIIFPASLMGIGFPEMV
jgi:hypothetical protein